MAKNSSVVLGAVAVLLGTASCGPLVQIGGGGRPPVALQTLRSDAPPVSSRADPKNTLLIAAPSVPGAITSTRLAVTTSDTEVSYFKDKTNEFAWSEPPAKLFQRLLADVAASRAGVTVVDGRQSDVPAARRLSGILFDFGLDVRNPSAPVVHIRFDATLTGRDGKLFATRRFEASEPSPLQTAPALGAALNRAANRVATDVASWVAAN